MQYSVRLVDGVYKQMLCHTKHHSRHHGCVAVASTATSDTEDSSYTEEGSESDVSLSEDISAELSDLDSLYTSSGEKRSGSSDSSSIDSLSGSERTLPPCDLPCRRIRQRL